MTYPASEDAMVSFICASGQNIRTSHLIQKVYTRVEALLVSSVAKRIEKLLADEPGWRVTSNTLASAPLERLSNLTWAPTEWEGLHWGIRLSAEQRRACAFAFGIYGPTATSKDPRYLQEAAKFPKMPEPDRDRLRAAAAPLLNSIGDRSGAQTSNWWPCYTYLHTIKDWTDPAMLAKLLPDHAARGGADLISSLPIESYVESMFRDAKAAMIDKVDPRDILAVSY